jgi:hypothetical protein
MQNLKIKYRKPKLLAALGEAPGATIRANTALIAARKALALLSWDCALSIATFTASAILIASP